MKFKIVASILVFGMGSVALAQSGAEKFVSNYAKLPKSYDAAQFEGKAVGEYGGCQLSISGGYMADGMKYLQLADDGGQAVFVDLDSTKNFPGNVIKISQKDQEPNGYDEGSLSVIYSLKLTVDDNGKPVRAVGIIDRPFPYSNSKIVCDGF